MQTTDTLLMIRPANFYYNTQTAINNSFQVANTDSNVSEKAIKEFDDFVLLLQQNGIDVMVIQDTEQLQTPDSVFPNNWISFHENGTIVLYPMFAENRRLERKTSVIETLKKKFTTRNTIDLSDYEKQNTFLEGTGSMVLDRTKKIAYACLSPRTDKKLLEEWCRKMNYTACCFVAEDENSNLIYHTNVMMCIAEDYAIICLDCIHNENEKQLVEQTILNSGKKIIEITLAQTNSFAGNMLQVKNKDGKRFLVMSSQAFESLTQKQKATIESFNAIIHSSLKTIETNGGGSARCMMAEVFN